MRLVVDNWILTTIRATDQQQQDQVKPKCLTVDQRVEQEQNLFDTSQDLDSSQSSSKSMNHKLDETSKMQNETDMIKDFASFLYNQLDVVTFGQVEMHIDELSSIVGHLDEENELLKKELNEQFFADQSQLVQFVQGTLRVKHLQICQLACLLERAHLSIFQTIESKLDQHGLNKAQIMFQQIQTAYTSHIDAIKTMLKLKINRLENYVNIWNEFENVCQKLNTILEQHTEPFVCSIQYRSISIEINNFINRLKEKLNKLTCVLSEGKYFEFKNLIVIYEIKFKRLKKMNETVSPEATVPTSAKRSVRITQPFPATPVSTREASMLPKYELGQTTSFTCDKATFTVNHESTQTEPIYESVMQHSDGKKMLLEAYLSNNENLASCSTSSKKNKSESGTGLMRESGIGTANDDDSLPLTDAEKHCDDEDKLNISVETYPIENHKKYSRKKANKLKSMSTMSTSSTCSSKAEHNLYHRKNKKSAKQAVDANNQTAPNNQSVLRFLIQKLIKFIFIFLVPILFILLFLAYVLYRNYLNPHCCDLKHNYLLINVT